MRLTTCVLPFLLLGLTACSEPGRQVTRSTEDGAFALSLKANRGWVRVNEVLPIEVKLVSLNGPLDDGLDEEIEFLVNNGSLDEDELDAVLEARDDEYPGDTIFRAWISFEADPETSTVTESQGEIHALFRDVLATLKIRIVASADDLDN